MLHLDAKEVPVDAPVLAVRGLTKVYGGTAALAGVDLEVGPGEIHALLGENGAGKSTLVRILAAVEHEDGGSIEVGGEALGEGRTPRSMSERGVAFIHQDLGLVASMTVAENIAQHVGYAVGAFGISWEATRRRALDALALLDQDLDPDCLVAELSIAEQATVAIVRALALDARLVVLDEPTASLAAGEARQLLEILHRLRATGAACVLVTHRLDEVMANCDRVTVLRNGALVGTRPVDELTRESLVEMIVGEVPMKAGQRRPRGYDGPARLAVEGFGGAGFEGVDLEVAPGEIVAVTGLADAGHLKLLDAIFGAARAGQGTVRLDGVAYAPSTPAHALAAGIHQVPADRNSDGLAAALSARENLFTNPAGRRLRALDLRAERARAAGLMDEFDVRPRDPEAQISMFSGGNAQKVLVARSLARDPRLLLLSEPTAGVDIGARATIYSKLRAACEEGLSILVATSDFEEVEDLADRAVVMFRGAVVRVLSGPEISVAALTSAAYGT